MSYPEHYDNVPFNFLALSSKLSDYATAAAVILPIPYDLTVSYSSGARRAPQAIINASRQVETYDFDLKDDPSQKGIATLPELEPVVSGPDEMQGVIYEAAKPLVDDGKFVLSLGGEHSITPALVKAYKGKYSDLAVVCIDAHSDLRDSYQGSRFSHACAMARVAESADFVSVGIRSFAGCELERKYAEKLITPEQFRADISIMKKQLSDLSKNIYLTFDLDGFDPSVMPALGTPEPGGLLWREVLSIINIVADHGKIVGADLVELSPIPGLTYPDFTAAKLAYKIIGKGISDA